MGYTDDFKKNRSKRFGEGNGRDRGPVILHKATCGQCGNPCEVPFRPLSGKTVYCTDCFQGKRDERGDRESGGYPRKRSNGYKSFAKPNFKDSAMKGSGSGVKEQLEILNAKIDRLIKAVEAMAKTGK
jgi:CxxC-x17-CxxC domain-containing protein